MIQISQIKLQPIQDETQKHLYGRLRKKIASILRIDEVHITDIRILKESIDARKKVDSYKPNQVFLIYTVSASVKGEDKILSGKKISNVSAYHKLDYDPICKEFSAKNSHHMHRPVVVGLGPCGLFCGYVLALNGYRPILIERGKCVDERQADVDAYWTEGILNPESNVQFGEGGAGTFSDGKLNTQIKDPSGRIRYVLNTLIEQGADPKIAYVQHPHVGTDVLKDVVKNLRNEIIRLGGEVRFSTRLSEIRIENDSVSAILVNDSEEIPCDHLVLAIGHSARDTFEMLKKNRILMHPKDFAVGYRVSHPQKFVNECQYGKEYADLFEAAPYKLTAKASDGRGVYTFCMCPGGYVVDASSEEGRLCVNGMSYRDRGSKSANSAVIVSIGPDDFSKMNLPGADYDPLVGMHFQRMIEENTFQRGNGKIPLQRFGDFYRDITGTTIPESENHREIPKTEAMIKGRWEETSLKGIYPVQIEKAFIEGMISFSRKMKGFDHPDALVMASETRTSSPVRIERNEDGMSQVCGLFPAGEGAGYAGGITSAAVDGIKIAEYVMKHSCNVSCDS